MNKTKNKQSQTHLLHSGEGTASDAAVLPRQQLGAPRTRPEARCLLPVPLPVHATAAAVAPKAKADDEEGAASFPSRPGPDRGARDR